MKRQSVIKLSTAAVLLAFVLIAAGASYAALGRLFGGRDEAPPQKPLARRYAKLVLGNNNAKTLFLVFDASRGTASGYDIVYADTGSFANLEQARKLEAKVSSSPGRAVCKYPPFEVDPPPAEKEDAKPTSASVLLCTCRSGDTETFCVTSRVSVGKGAADWLYASTARVVPATIAEKAPVIGMNRPPKLTIETKPDLNKKGNLGIALAMAYGEESLEITRAGGPLDATVVIKTPDGKVVKEDTQKIDKFAFG